MTRNELLDHSLGGTVSRETHVILEALVTRVIDENQRQNLISAATIDSIWTRHIADSLQLLRYAVDGDWLDLGTGAGFPGLAVAAAMPNKIALCESRRLRAEFLAKTAHDLGLANVCVHNCRVESLELPAVANISARAFAPLDRLLSLAHRFSTEKTRWILPKGRGAHAELELARTKWHGDFRLEQSVTDPNSAIIVATGVVPRKRR